MRTRTLALIALGAIVTSVAVGFIIHLLLGLLVLRIAVRPSAVTGRQAALALAQVFSADHPRVRVRTVVMPDLLAAARALDKEDVDLAIGSQRRGARGWADTRNPAARCCDLHCVDGLRKRMNS